MPDIEIYETYSEKETADIAFKMAEGAVPGQVFSLEGDLGVGKTVFTKGFGRGLGIDEPIVSPTFTILQTYESGRLPFYHFDVYRIGDSEEMYETGFEDCIYGNGITMVEWASLISDIMPEETIGICIEKDLSKGLDYRKITVRR